MVLGGASEPDRPQKELQFFKLFARLDLSPATIDLMKTPRNESSATLDRVAGHNGKPQSAIDWPAALQENRRWLRSVLRCRVSDAHAVEDLLQEIAVAVFRQASKPTDPAKVAPWLYRLAVRFTINFHRHNGRKRKLNERIQQLMPSDESQDQTDALDWLVQTEQRQIVHRALHQLRAQDREILILKYAENWTYRQLSQHLGANLNTIEYRLLVAKRRLRKLLVADNTCEANK